MKRSVFIVLIAILSLKLSAQGGFSKVFSQSPGTYTGCVGPGNTYLASGQVPVSGGRTGAFLLLLDSTGAVLKADTLVNPHGNYVPGVQGCAHYVQGSYWIAGQTYLRGWVAKLNDNLDTIWSKVFRFQDSVNTVLHASLVLGRQGIVVTGTASAVPAWDSIGRRTLYLARLDSVGAHLWEHSYFAPEPSGKAMWQWGNAVIQAPDGGYLVSGSRAEEGNKKNTIDYLFMKTDSLGNKQWLVVDGTPFSDHSAAVKPYSDSSFMVVSTWAQPKDPSLHNTLYDGKIKLETRRYSNGSVIRSKIIGPYYPGNALMSFVGDDTSGYTILGNYIPGVLQPPDSARPYYYGGYLLKINSQWDSMWYRELAHSKKIGADNLLYDLRATPDGGAVAFGYVFNTRRYQLWVAKTDSMGCVTDQCHTIGQVEFKTNRLQIELYPNPAGDFTQIEGLEPFRNGKLRLRVYTVTGQLVEDKQVQLPYLYETKSLKPGIYILKYDLSGILMGEGSLIKV